ncbi:tetratricopeptide repeat domain protein [Beauveria bassiana ARSEF 2860]|uniref:Tetratricopeptide repeat domain protein n=1 Tax=Beauveria bassiana (strain ARSEF 2860) TaxID=655819 RepID=J4VR35_BEAB2|nr:tetratricopeptide repeat domain protein [Beauveria bassiana ARSEF 2860]EJP61120.1 tetratricopeptide repeat domain protein [Beauveria bassiana ARSEF 2860]
MSAPQPPADRKSFRVAILCALPHEADAVALLFDQFWDEERGTYGRANGDNNTYNTGRIGQHHVVLAVLPHIGTSSAAATTASLRSSYTNLRLAILVGICGGVPRIKDDNVFLGDVVISQIIIQYDYGRQYPSHFAIKSTIEDSLGRANTDIGSLVDGGDFIPGIFIGRIGSGNTVMKSGEDRDRIAADNDLIAFEMEGAGAWDQVPCIVVKGICDYADSHKNKSWQDFAAATAASVAKAILERYQVHDEDRETTLKNSGI